jgi:hypothetical protein
MASGRALSHDREIKSGFNPVTAVSVASRARTCLREIFDPTGFGYRSGNGF